jgi:hypothetical protein
MICKNKNPQMQNAPVYQMDGKKYQGGFSHTRRIEWDYVYQQM